MTSTQAFLLGAFCGAGVMFVLWTFSLFLSDFVADAVRQWVRTALTKTKGMEDQTAKDGDT